MTMEIREGRGVGKENDHIYLAVLFCIPHNNYHEMLTFKH